MLTKYAFIVLIGVNCVFACFDFIPNDDRYGGYGNIKYPEFQNECLTEKKLDAEMMPKNTTFWLDSKDDKHCLNQCMMEKMGMLEDGDVHRGKFETYVDRMLNYDFLNRKIIPQCYSETYTPKNDDCWSPSNVKMLVFQRNEKTGKNITTKQIVQDILPQAKIEPSEVESIRIFSSNIFFIIFNQNNEQEFISAANRLKNQKFSVNGSSFSLVDGCTVFSTVILPSSNYNTGISVWDLKENFGHYVEESQEDREIDGVKTNEIIFWMDFTKPFNAKEMNVQVIEKFKKIDNKMMTTTESPNTVSCRNVNNFLRCVAKRGNKICNRNN